MGILFLIYYFEAVEYGFLPDKQNDIEQHFHLLNKGSQQSVHHSRAIYLQTNTTQPIEAAPSENVKAEGKAATFQDKLLPTLPICPKDYKSPPTNYAKLRSINDITTEKDVEIILEYFQPSNYYLSQNYDKGFNQDEDDNSSSFISQKTFNYISPYGSIPQPTMQDQNKLPLLCKNYGWKFCNNLVSEQQNSANEKFYKCESRPLVVKVNCAYVDGMMGPDTYGGTVYDHNRKFYMHATQHATEEKKLNSEKFKQQKGGNIIVYDRLAHALAVYPKATAHIFERLHRFFLLVEALDKYHDSPIPILVPDTDLFRNFLKMLNKHKIPGFHDLSRFIPYNGKQLYFASEVYFAGEIVKLPEETKWSTNRREECSWALTQKRDIFQSVMQSIFNSPFVPEETEVEASSKTDDTLQILVVHRSDSSCRRIENHDALLNSLKTNTRLPSLVSPVTKDNIKVKVIEFIGNQHDIEDTMRLFATSHIVIAPHGAALTFTAAMPRGGSVIEVGYTDKDGMMWPGNYFHTMVIGSGLTYYLSLGRGAYCHKPITADIEDVNLLVEKAAKNMLQG